MKKRRGKFTKGEMILFFGVVGAVICTFFTEVFFGANIGHLNMSVEKIKYEINNQEKNNENLSMQVNELTSFDKINNIVKDMGLAYNNKNIVIVNE
jgi:cell division protein FtsL